VSAAPRIDPQRRDDHGAIGHPGVKPRTRHQRGDKCGRPEQRGIVGSAEEDCGRARRSLPIEQHRSAVQADTQSCVRKCDHWQLGKYQLARRAANDELQVQDLKARLSVIPNCENAPWPGVKRERGLRPASDGHRPAAVRLSWTETTSNLWRDVRARAALPAAEAPSQSQQALAKAQPHVGNPLNSAASGDRRGTSASTRSHVASQLALPTQIWAWIVRSTKFG